MTTGDVGVVYLIHFARPYRHAQHYVGFCGSYEGVESRLDYHAKGRGSRLLAAVSRAAIPWRIVRLWRGTRTDERRLHARGDSRTFCPACSSIPARRRGLEEIVL